MQNSEMMFAVITPLLLTAQLLNEMKFSAFVLFIAAWTSDIPIRWLSLDLGWRLAW
jgi:ammonia channel protein AmtB